MLRMLRGVRGQKGQGMAAEYVLVIVVSVMALSAMMIYLRRGLQGRVRDVNHFMVGSAAKAFSKNVQLEYEPYYVASVLDQDMAEGTRTEVQGAPGIIKKTIYVNRQIKSISSQYPPKNAI